jgi:glycerol-3-phosphate acyltransferase PlsY
MIDILLCILIGYALGCISPSVIISKILHRNLKEEGTGNYGATNVTMVLGRGFGAFVMLFDIAKGAFAYLVASWIFTDFAYAGLVSGLAAVLGHCYPFYIKFKGGKGLAAYGGVILAYDPLLFAIVLACAMVLMLIVNYSFIFPYSGSFLVCVLATIKTKDPIIFILLAVMAAVIMTKHFSNMKKALKSSDIGVRDYIVKHIIKKNKSADGK